MRGFRTFLLVNALWLSLLFVVLVIRRQVARAAFAGPWGGWQRSVGTPSWIERSDIETPKARLGGGPQGVHRGYRVLYCGHGGYYVPRRLTAQDPMPGHWTGIRRLVVLRREGLSLETLRRSGSGAGFDWVGNGDIFEARPDAGSAHVGWFTRPRRLTRQLDAIADAADEFFKVHVDSADGR